MCPIEKYIRTIRKPTERPTLFLSADISLLSDLSPASDDSPPDSFFLLISLSDAPYPARSTAIMSSAETFPSTPISPVNRLTEQESTPFTADTAFSTRAEHAAQLIPVTL